MSNLILPTNFVGDRIFVCPITIDGVKLTFYTDTGGGAMLIAPSTVERLNLEVFKETTDEGELESVHFPEFRADAYLPSAINSGRIRISIITCPSGWINGSRGLWGARYFVTSPSRWIIRMQWLIFIDKLFRRSIEKRRRK